MALRHHRPPRAGRHPHSDDPLDAGRPPSPGTGPDQHTARPADRAGSDTVPHLV